MAAAIQASLSEMSVQEPQQNQNGSNNNNAVHTNTNTNNITGENNQISQESYDYLSAYAGVPASTDQQ